MFDINDGKWYTQTATGEVPQLRRGACAGVIWAKDRSSPNLLELAMDDTVSVESFS
jgi:hypothetical protein